MDGQPPTARECERAFAKLILADPRHCRVGASTRQFVEGYMDEPYVPSRYKLQASDTHGLHPEEKYRPSIDIDPLEPGSSR